MRLSWTLSWGLPGVLVVFLSALLALLPREGLSAEQGRGYSGTGRKVRMMTYNIWGLPGVLLQKPKRMNLLEAALPAENADIIILNETFAARTRPVVMLKEYPYRAFGPGKSGVKISSGVVILSKFPIVESETLKYSACAGMDCLANKGAVRARLDVPGVGLVDVVGTHLNSDGKDSVRSAQLEQVDELLARAGGNVPVLFGGDFNFHSETAPYSDMVGAMGFRDLHAEYRTFHPELDSVAWFGFTYDPDRNSNLTWQAPMSRAERLDYIWARDGACAGIQVEQTALLMDHKVGGLHLSDHFGVRADLTLQGVADAASCR